MGFCTTTFESENGLRENLSSVSKSASREIFGSNRNRTYQIERNPLETQQENLNSLYKTASGRSSWLGRDPIEEKGGVTLYEFCYNNPFMYYDELGELPVWIPWVVGAIGGAIVGDVVIGSLSGKPCYSVGNPEIRGVEIKCRRVCDSTRGGLAGAFSYCSNKDGVSAGIAEFKCTKDFFYGMSFKFSKWLVKPTKAKCDADNCDCDCDTKHFILWPTDDP